LQRAVAFEDASPLYHCEFGETLLQAGRVTDCKRELSRTLELDPKSAGAYYRRARALRQEGDLTGAIHDLEAAVAIDPGITLAYHDLWRLYKVTGQPEKAAAALAKSEELRGKMRDEQEEVLRNEEERIMGETLLAPE